MENENTDTKVSTLTDNVIDFVSGREQASPDALPTR
jgi:hypothetical protein